MIKKWLETIKKLDKEHDFQSRNEYAFGVVKKLLSVFDPSRLADIVDAGPDRVVVGVRKDVATFALAMEAVLKTHDDRPGWEDGSWDYLSDRLEDEIAEMHKVLDLDFPGKYVQGAFKIAYCHELLDIANFCMMIYCNEQRDAALEGADHAD